MRRFRFIYRGSGGPEDVVIELDGTHCVLYRGGKAERAVLVRLADGRLSLLLDDGRQICGRVLSVSEGEVEVVMGSSRRRVALADPLRDRIAHAEESGGGEQADEEIRALMPGRVVEIHVAQGDTVPAAGLILVLEAMKMQNEIRSSRAGTVLRICVEAGKPVEGGSLLAVVRAVGS